MNSENPWTVLVLALAVVIAAVASLPLGTRGGRFRGLPGWSGFWVFFSIVLVVLSRAKPWLSFPLLGLVLLASLREYFFLAPLRPQDRWAILFAYLSVPASLYPVWADSFGLFLTAILIYLFLLLPTGLSLGSAQKGLLDSVGRVLLGLLVFVFCGGHLAWMTHQPVGHLELFGALVLAAELPQRIAGRPRLHDGVLRSSVGLGVAIVITGALGAWLGPWIGVSPRQGVIAAELVCLSVTAGGVVTGAVAHDLSLRVSTSRVGRAALLDRITPAIYAAPLYYHYLDHFA